MGVSGQRHAPAALYPGERTPGTHWIGGWVGPRAGLDAGARRKILCPCWGSNPDHPARSQTLYCLSYRGSYSHNIVLKHQKSMFFSHNARDQVPQRYIGKTIHFNRQEHLFIFLNCKGYIGFLSIEK
jgi:hypothetical protein